MNLRFVLASIFMAAFGIFALNKLVEKRPSRDNLLWKSSSIEQRVESPSEHIGQEVRLKQSSQKKENL